jgi:preprotein translocase subunit SecG
MSVRNRRLVVRGAVAALLLVLLVLLQVSGRPTQAGGQATALDTFTCTPAGVATFANRVHVRCTTLAPGNIRYFAVCTAPDSVAASRYLSVFTTALVMGKTLTIYYTPSDLSGGACGCQSGDCRVIWGAEVMQ